MNKLKSQDEEDFYLRVLQKFIEDHDLDFTIAFMVAGFFWLLVITLFLLLFGFFHK